MAKKPQPKQSTQVAPKRQDPGNQLWELANELRRLGKFPSMADLLSSARAKGVSFGWDAIYAISILQRAGGPMVIPPFIPRFISAYISDKGFKSALDPWAGIGSLFLPLKQALKIQKATGITRNQNDYEVAKLLDETSDTQWLLGDPKAFLETLGDFDLVISAPPFGLQTVSETFKTKDGAFRVADSETYVLALKTALHLTNTGEAIFLFPNNFFFKTGANTVREALPKLGLFINAIIALPAGTFSPLTSIESNLVFISRRETPTVFVGQLREEQDPKQLLKNLQKQETGAVPELGRLVQLADYRSLRAIVDAEEVVRLADRSGLSLVQLSELVESVNLADRKKEEGSAFEDLPNCVFLPLIGTSPAVTAPSDFRIKPHNYVQLVVRQEKAYAEFLAGFFNSPLGRKTRDALLRGAFIPKITKQSLLQGSIYVAPPDAQRKAIETQREIEELQLRLGQLQRQLWNRPIDAESVRKGVSSINQKESFESWLETLPFPLASVLWRYQATTNVEHKTVHLLNFFEAAAQFLGGVMASAFHSNAQFFQSHKQEWFETGKDNPHSLTRSNFGEWVVRCQRLAKTTRQMLSSGEDERQNCLNLFKTSDAAPIECVSDKAVYSVLEKTGRYRIDWKGHTGIVSAKEYTRRLTLLREELTRFWSALGSAFEQWWLIRPGTNQYTAGVYRYTAKKLMGSRQIPKEVEVETSTVMDSKELYFFDPTARQPLLSLHFFRMMPSPETEEIACYFYNRLEKEGIRWVSYHFERKAERVESDPAILKIIQEIEENNA